MSKGIERIIVERALELLKGGHTRRTGARDGRGRYVVCTSETAIRFCALGAIWRATREVMGTPRGKGIASMTERECGLTLDISGRIDRDLIEINDNKGKEAVLALFERRLREL